jgi:protein-L-isoaspartate O-methyltransferase
MEHGITPRELWELLDSDGRLFVPVGERSRFVVGQLGSGRWIGFLAQEAEDQDEVWDIVAARQLDQQEISQVRRARGDRDA